VPNARDLDRLALISEARAAGETGRGRALRRASRLTQDEVAAAITTRRHPVTRSVVAMWEGCRRRPSGPRALEYGRLLRALEQQKQGEGCRT
jgi:DNA-binding transcriptional regulator YiaG